VDQIGNRPENNQGYKAWTRPKKKKKKKKRKENDYKEGHEKIGAMWIDTGIVHPDLKLTCARAQRRGPVRTDLCFSP